MTISWDKNKFKNLEQVFPQTRPQIFLLIVVVKDTSPYFNITFLIIRLSCSFIF